MSSAPLKIERSLIREGLIKSLPTKGMLYIEVNGVYLLLN